MGLRRGFVAEVEWLRVVFARKFEHFLAGDVIMAEKLLDADFQIFEIDHGAGLATDAGGRKRRVARGRGAA